MPTNTRLLATSRWVSLLIEDFLSVVVGVVGLWTVFFRRKRAAKTYMLAWPARFLLAGWRGLELRPLHIKYDVQLGYLGMSYLLFFIILYHFKLL